MKTRGLLLPLVILGVCMLGFTTDVLLTAPQLPERAATHFGTDGRPNDWMTRAGYARFMIGFGLGLPVFILLVSAIVTRLGGAGLNIPHRDYWLAPERRAETLAFMQRKLVWFACLLVAFMTMLNHVILRANAQTPVRLSGAELLWPVGVFLAAIGVWTVLFIRPFLRKA